MQLIQLLIDCLSVQTDGISIFPLKGKQSEITCTIANILGFYYIPISEIAPGCLNIYDLVLDGNPNVDLSCAIPGSV